MSSLFLYKKLRYQSGLDAERVRGILEGFANKSSYEEELAKLEPGNWKIEAGYRDDHFRWLIRPETSFPAYHTIPVVANGNIQPGQDGSGTKLVLKVQVAVREAFFLLIIFSLLLAAFVYGLTSHSAELSIVSSILIISSYILVWLYFNALTRRYRILAGCCFSDSKYHITHLSEIP